MKPQVEQFEIIGDIPDGAMASLARMLLDLADRELAAEDDASLESRQRVADNERTAGALATPQRL